MSHFAVAVLNDGKRALEGLLSPYMENCCGTPDYAFMEFYDGAEQYGDEYENGTVPMVKCPDGSLASKYDEQFEVIRMDGKFPSRRYEYPDGYEVVDVPCKEAFPTIEEYLSNWYGMSEDEITGRYGYWQNPNAKWDWYDETGGRFKGYAENLVGFQHGKVSDIEFDPEAHRRAAEKWWDENIDEDGNPKGMAIFEYDGLDRERYIESRSHLSFRAVVTPDGVWHEVGEMGWWGMSSEDADETYEWRMHFEERFIEPYQNCTLTVVDCHI